MSHRKYLREEKSKADQKQMLLSPGSPNFVKSKKIPEVQITEKYTERYRCAFCFHQDRINAFLISTKKGYHRGLVKCPECGNQMQIKTLTADWTPEQYAEWVFEYRHSGFWQKIKFSQWKERLASFGWNLRFWVRYKELKGDTTNETYEQYIERVQQEEHMNEGHDE